MEQAQKNISEKPNPINFCHFYFVYDLPFSEWSLGDYKSITDEKYRLIDIISKKFKSMIKESFNNQMATLRFPHTYQHPFKQRQMPSVPSPLYSAPLRSARFKTFLSLFSYFVEFFRSLFDCLK